LTNISVNIIGGAAVGNTGRGVQISGATTKTTATRCSVVGVLSKGNGAAQQQIAVSNMATGITVTGCNMVSATAGAIGLFVAPTVTNSFFYGNNFDIPIPESLSNIPVMSGGGSAVSQWRGVYAPEGAVAASPGSLFQMEGSSLSTALHVKQTGTGNTGWVPAAVKVATPADYRGVGVPGQFSADANSVQFYIGDGATHQWKAAVTGATAATNLPLSLWSGTKAQYDAIATKSATTIYVVTTAAATLEGVVDGVTSGVDTGQISSEETALESAQNTLEAVQTGDIVVDPPARTATTKSTRKK
jgi:hypothetical protein